MDYKDILSVDLKRKSKKEIIEFLSNVIGEYGIALEYGVLKNILNQEQVNIIDNAIESDERSFAEGDTEFTEEDIQAWLEEDSISRRLVFSKNEEGKIMLSDLDARMQDVPEIGEMIFEDVDVSKFVGVVQQGFDYTLGMGGMQHDYTEIGAIQEELQYFTSTLAEVNSIKSNIESAGPMKANALLSLMKLTEMPIGVRDIESLMGAEEAKTAKEGIEGLLFSLYPDNGMFSPEKSQEFRDKARLADNFYRVGTAGNRLALVGSRLPNFKFDAEKLANSEVLESLIGIIERNQEPILSRYNGFFGEELKGIIESVTNSKEINISDVIRKMAQEEAVAKENFNARESFEEIKTKDMQELREQEGMEL